VYTLAAASRGSGYLFGVPEAALPGALHRGLHRRRGRRELLHGRARLQQRDAEAQ